jgi:DNA-binding SARP family transcriptional activator
VAREQYHQLRLNALEAMCERLTAARQYGFAVSAGLAVVRAEPLRESAHEALVKVHLAAGNRCEALRQFDRCKALLRTELGVEPSPALRNAVTLQSTRAALGAGSFAKRPSPLAWSRPPHGMNRAGFRSDS